MKESKPLSIGTTAEADVVTNIIQCGLVRVHDVYPGLSHRHVIFDAIEES